MAAVTLQAQRYREAAWNSLRDGVFDLLIIGGGINGAGVARDAVLRGMSVALVERTDFAAGTSSRSSKLIHGGVRYLEQGAVRLVLESCRERDLLRTRTAPHLVRAQRFVFPVYDDDETPLWRLRAGLILYDLLAGFRNVDPHRMLSPSAAVAREPGILSRGLRGAALYYDCWTDDARLTLETMLAARAGGATVLNYAEVTALEKDSTGRLAAAEVCDRFSGEKVRVRARWMLNVTGPWLDHIRRLDDAGTPPRLRLTKGVHAVFDRSRIGNRDAIVMRGADDKRVMFAIPWQQHALVGTTDTFYEGDPAEVVADSDDIDYILAATNRAFPNANLTVRDVISTYAGLRPLVAPEDEIDESDISREDQIFESPAGLISLGGGKLTTHRHVAERIVDVIVDRLGRHVGPCRTTTVALPAATDVVPGGVRTDPPASREEHLRWRYGAIASEVSAVARGDDALGQRLVDDLPELAAEVVYAVEREMAMTIGDVLARRLAVHLRSRHRAEGVARQVAAIMAERLGWEAGRIESEVARYQQLVASSPESQAASRCQG